jgi:hypothetical protein
MMSLLCLRWPVPSSLFNTDAVVVVVVIIVVVVIVVVVVVVVIVVVVVVVVGGGSAGQSAGTKLCWRTSWSSRTSGCRRLLGGEARGPALAALTVVVVVVIVIAGGGAGLLAGTKPWWRTSWSFSASGRRRCLGGEARWRPDKAGPHSLHCRHRPCLRHRGSRCCCR